jgi:DNA polymerase III subunit beta
MNVVIDKNSILLPVTKLVGITEKRSLMPILSNVLIEFSSPHSSIYSTDLELSAIGRIDYKSGEHRKVVVHGRKFLDIIKEMDSGDIQFEIEENVMSIKQKNTEIVLSLQDPEEFPEVKEMKGGEEFSIDGEILLELIEKVDFAVSMDESRYVLTGMHVKGAEGKITVVGTDGFRMALCEKEISGMRAFKGITMPKRAVTEIERVVEGGDKVALSIGEKQVQVSTDKIVVVTRVIEGVFPDYENVVPHNNENVVRVEREALNRGLKRVSAIMGRSEPVRMTLSEGKMEIQAESDIGRAREIIPIDHTGTTTVMNFNARFLMDAVSHIGGDTLTMSAPPTYGAVLFMEEGSENYINVVMPIRV